MCPAKVVTNFTILFLFLLLQGTLVEMSKQNGPPNELSHVNLTAITWAHAVNSQKLLDDTLKTDINFIEADIVFGTLDNDPNQIKQPVMGHPPAETSDISLKSFLNQIFVFNSGTPNKKGVKLDFKSIEVFDASLDLLQSIWNTLDYPIWINADIIPGPVNNNVTIPVDPKRFFSGCKKLTNSVLSIGWTTKWGNDYTKGTYTTEQTYNMVNAIRTNDIDKTNHSITFPIRAGIAAQSLIAITDLMETISQTNSVTVTIWSSVNDSVDIQLLKKLIFSIGIDRVYLDVPKEVSDHLHLDYMTGHATSLIHFGIASMAMLFVSIILNNCQF